MNDQAQNHPNDEAIEVTLRLKPQTLLMVDRFCHEFGLSSRSAVISRLLDELFCDADAD